MKIRTKRLTGLGLATTLFGATALTACPTPPTEPPAETAAAEGEAGAQGEGEGEAGAHVEGEGEGEAAHDAHSGEGEGEGGEGEGGGGHDMGTLPVEKRVAFMSGHIEAGLALYRAGAPEQASKHLLHPVSETHQAERAGIDALGFEAEVFEKVSKALADGTPASELEPQLQAAEANMKLMQEKAGGSPKAIIEYLMETVVEEYKAGVRDGEVKEAGEYQDAFGFTVVALKIAKRVEGDKAESTRKELETLVAMWPENGPLADSTPKPVSEVSAQASKVMLELSNLE